MEVLMNGATILNAQLLVVVEIKCACVPALTPYHKMEENHVWVAILRAENAILNPVQVQCTIKQTLQSTY